MKTTIKERAIKLKFLEIIPLKRINEIKTYIKPLAPMCVEFLAIIHVNIPERIIPDSIILQLIFL